MMKAPSPKCLQALRLIVFPSVTTSCLSSSRRCYAAIPERRSRAAAPPPPRTTKPIPNSEVFRPSPSGSDLRKKRDDDEDFTPYPITRPIGMPNPPQPGENWGIDTRSLRQRRDDFHNYEKHLEKRARMTKQLSKPYFRDWSNMRFHKGKVFIANDRLFRDDVALFFPNFFGKTLRKDAPRTAQADGYKGLGRDTSNVMEGRVSLVSIVSNQWAQDQVNSFVSAEANPELHQVLGEATDVAQRVEINHENNFLKWHIMQWFAVPSLRKMRSLHDQERYFMVRRGVNEMMKEAIGLLNDKGGYVYLVDGECKIRWAGSAVALPNEKQTLVKGLRRLIEEARTPPSLRQRAVEENERLSAAVAAVTEENPATLTAAAT
nr:mitochondrial atpase complex subunit atp10 [Quercus suber]